MLIIWFDSNNGRFYLRLVSNYYDKHIGFINSYGHEIVNMYGYDHKTETWIQCTSHLDFYRKCKEVKPTAKRVIKSKLIDFINKL